MTHNRSANLTAPGAVAPRLAHPRGLYTLFFTEMWERFSFYGMRALLVLFMVDSVRRDGMGLTDEVATAIYGLYTAGVYLACLPGGWAADRLFGAQRAVWYGGISIAAGHFALAVPRVEFFFLGLILVVVGTGLLKPNISAIVGQLYPEGGARRDAGFTVFYMGINLGAAIGPLICSSLGEKINWHYGFAAAGVGMLLGLVQFRLTAHYLGDAGKYPEKTTTQRRDRLLFATGLGAIALVTVLGLTGLIRLNPMAMARGTTSVILVLAALYFAGLFLFAGLNAIEKRRLAVIAVLFVASAMFWSGFEQAGSSLNLFAERFTDRTIGGFETPAGWFQVFNPVFIIALAPVVAMVWVALARRQRNPSLPAKFALGLILLGGGFLVMVLASRLALDGDRVWPTWLITTYLLHSLGELCLSPVGLSSVTKLSPPRLVGQMMGLWFLATSLGNLIAGLIAGEVSGAAEAQMPARFLQIVLTTCGTGLLLLIFTRPIKKLMAGVE
ncbi:MAG: peptide MFS transporter [Verrucomicrobia bacterium]|nr:peptide MFS transporter [Verrucomicrobiota bacterium]